MQQCIWQANGDLVCGNGGSGASPAGLEGYRDPKTDPKCAEYGCAAGRSCKNTGECANGLSCDNGVCARLRPEDRGHSYDDNARRDREKRRYAEEDARREQRRFDEEQARRDREQRQIDEENDARRRNEKRRYEYEDTRRDKRRYNDDDNEEEEEDRRDRRRSRNDDNEEEEEDRRDRRRSRNDEDRRRSDRNDSKWWKWW